MVWAFIGGHWTAGQNQAGQSFSYSQSPFWSLHLQNRHFYFLFIAFVFCLIITCQIISWRQVQDLGAQAAPLRPFDRNSVSHYHHHQYHHNYLHHHQHSTPHQIRWEDEKIWWYLDMMRWYESDHMRRQSNKGIRDAGSTADFRILFEILEIFDFFWNF